MAEQSMVERVRAAIAQFNLDEMSPGYDADMTKAARAAIEAMREPSEIMCARMYHEFCGSCGTPEELMGNAWRAAIDATLKSPPAPQDKAP